MGRGFMLYPIPSEGATDLRTFAPAPMEEIGTVDEQLAVWNAWLEEAKRQRQVDTSQSPASDENTKPPKASFLTRIWKRK